MNAVIPLLFVTNMLTVEILTDHILAHAQKDTLEMERWTAQVISRAKVTKIIHTIYSAENLQQKIWKWEREKILVFGWPDAKTAIEQWRLVYYIHAIL